MSPTFLVGSHSREKPLLNSSCRLPAYISSVPTGPISVKFDIEIFMKILEQIQFRLKSGKVSAISREDLNTFYFCWRHQI